MANVTLYQALKTPELANLKYSELDDAVNYYWMRVLSTPKNYATFLFKYGMPSQWAAGKYGYEVFGLSGLHVLPEPKKLGHRVSMRYAPPQNYLKKYGNYFRFVVPFTDYPKERKLKLQKPEHFLTMCLLSIAETYPLYLKYLSYFILKGKTKQLNKLDPVLNNWVGRFIEPSDGAQNGYPFYLSEGYGTVNLDDVINKKKVTNHPLKEGLKKINDELTKDSKKIEYDWDTDPLKLKDKKLIRDNITDDKTKKFIGLCLRIRKEIRDILEIGAFPDVKYKVKNDADTWEGILPPIKGPSELVLVISKESADKWDDQKIFLTPGKFQFDPNSSFFEGVEVVRSDALDENTAYLITRDLIQIWFMPILSRNYVDPYINEETIDYKHEFGHSLEMVDIHCNIYFATKG